MKIQGLIATTDSDDLEELENPIMELEHAASLQPENAYVLIDDEGNIPFIAHNGELFTPVGENAKQRNIKFALQMMEDFKKKSIGELNAEMRDYFKKSRTAP
jgi:hypothetical protein